MKMFFDTEFVDNGPNDLHLISIGVVAEDGGEFYAENKSINLPALLNRCASGEWLKANVVPHLVGGDALMTPGDIANRLHRFVFDRINRRAEFWGYFVSYDWVLLSQLYGRMLDVPREFGLRANDVLQLATVFNVRDKPEADYNHNALVDARWTKAYYDHIVAEVAKKAQMK